MDHIAPHVKVFAEIVGLDETGSTALAWKSRRCARICVRLSRTMTGLTLMLNAKRDEGLAVDGWMMMLHLMKVVASAGHLLLSAAEKADATGKDPWPQQCAHHMQTTPQPAFLLAVTVSHAPAATSFVVDLEL